MGGVGCPGNCASCGEDVVEVGFGGMAVEILFALDLRLEPNPRLFKRAFIELIRSTKGGIFKSSRRSKNGESKGRRRRDGIALYRWKDGYPVADVSQPIDLSLAS